MRKSCKIFGHKWVFNPIDDIRPYCQRCGTENLALDKQYFGSFKIGGDKSE